MIKIRFIAANEMINLRIVIGTSNGGDFTPVRMCSPKILNILSIWNQTQSHPGSSRVPITSFYPKFSKTKLSRNDSLTRIKWSNSLYFLPRNEPIVFLITGKTLDFPSQLVIFYTIFLHLVYR